MTYRVIKEKNLFHIIEKDTNQVIEKIKDERKARDICRSLNLGAGFNGYTPAFFTQDFKQKERPPTK